MIFIYRIKKTKTKTKSMANRIQMYNVNVGLVKKGCICVFNNRKAQKLKKHYMFYCPFHYTI